MNVIKQKHIQRTNQRLPVGRQFREGQDRGKDLRDMNYKEEKKNKTQGLNVQHREYNNIL